MNTDQFISMIKSAAAVRPLGKDRFLVSYFGSEEAIVTVKVIDHTRAADEAYMTGSAKKCLYCRKNKTVKADGKFIIHGPKLFRCPGSNQRYLSVKESPS